MLHIRMPRESPFSNCACGKTIDNDVAMPAAGAIESKLSHSASGSPSWLTDDNEDKRCFVFGLNVIKQPCMRSHSTNGPSHSTKINPGQNRESCSLTPPPLQVQKCNVFVEFSSC